MCHRCRFQSITSKADAIVVPRYGGGRRSPGCHGIAAAHVGYELLSALALRKDQERR